MKRWLIVLCLVVVHDSAIAATPKKSDAPLWKQFLSLFSPVAAPAHARRHVVREHVRFAEPEPATGSVPTPDVPRVRHHVSREPQRVAEPEEPTSAETPEPASEAPHVRHHVAREPQRIVEPTEPASAETPAPAPEAPHVRHHVAREPLRVAQPTQPVSAEPAEPAPAETPSAPAVERAAEPPAIRPRVGSGDRDGRCGDGERIVSAYYWEGRHTASGQPFDPHGLTAAHRTLPFGTRLTVINPRTGQSVTVTINDRGPYTRGVSLDLSLGAAQVIGMHGTGVVCIL
jgi:rare lipoprotein A